MRFISRSSYESYNTCPRKHYYNYEWDGTGVDTTEPNIDLCIGLGVHKGMELLLSGIPPEQAAERGREEFLYLTSGGSGENVKWNSMVREGAVLVYAFVRGFLKAHPTFLEDYRVVSVEEEVRAPLSGDVVLMARADAVLEDRDNFLWVLNHKTCTSWDSSDWMYDVQMWTEAMAIEQKYGRPVVGCIITGFLKGGRYAGLLSSPLIYSWDKEKDGEVRTSDTYVAGWKKRLLAEEEAEEKLPRLELEKFFPISPPVTRNDAVVDAWVSQVVRRESENYHILRDGSEDDRLMHFWQRVSKWNCPRCPYVDVCFGRSTVLDLMAAGKLARRVDHHSMEVVNE